ncbi:MAG TPA: M28 family metallopeptidase [Thermoleophilaceae bacterium]|nr:M28 family metallopeptidase [Thermoleophilaceae bacterium]
MRLRCLTAGLAAAAVIAGCGDDGPSPPNRFDAAGAMELVRTQVALGPRPAGSRASRDLAERLRQALPGGRFQRVPGGLRNVIGTVPGRDPKRVVVIGAHYDTKDIPGFVGAIDGASGTAVLVQLAKTLRPGQAEPTVVFALFDGEESPKGTPEGADAFERRGLRGSKVAAPKLKGAEAMVLLDFVGNQKLALIREALSDEKLWNRMRAAAKRVGAGWAFPPGIVGEISDDHLPFIEEGVPAVDLIDFDFPCWHKTCDDLSQVSERSLDATGEAVLELILSS